MLRGVQRALQSWSISVASARPDLFEITPNATGSSLSCRERACGRPRCRSSRNAIARQRPSDMARSWLVGRAKGAHMSEAAAPATAALTEELWGGIGDTYQAILEHPFVQGLTDGSLARESFEF